MPGSINGVGPVWVKPASGDRDGPLRWTAPGAPLRLMVRKIRPLVEGFTVMVLAPDWVVWATVPTAFTTTVPPLVPKAEGVKLTVVPVLALSEPLLPLSTSQLTSPVSVPFCGTALKRMGSAPVSTLTAAGDTVSLGPVGWIGPSSEQLSWKA